MSYKKTVCVDLDGVLATYSGWKGVDHIGEPRPGAAAFLAKLRVHARVVIFTTRTKADFDDRPPGATPETLATGVRRWLDLHGLEYDEVYVGQGKPMAAAYLDDRAVPIPPNPETEHWQDAYTTIQRLLGK